jgi:glycosyltransferase involved in cell wall biosynthesis
MPGGRDAHMPRVLFIVDRPNWAHDRKTDSIARELAGRYEVTKRYQADVTAGDFDQTDCVVLYYWLQIDRLPHLREAFQSIRDRLAIGICSHFELAGAWRAPGLATLNELPSAVFANNQTLCDEFAPLLNVPVHYTPNGIDTTFFHPPPGSSRVSPNTVQAISRFLRKVGTWRRDHARSTLRVGWAGSLSNQGQNHRGVHEFIKPAVEAVDGAELCLAAREERWRNRDEMLEYYHSLDVYVCASHSEGTPNPCLEAAACGLPVVTTRVGNMPEFIRDGETGLFVERSVADIAEKLRRLRDSPALRSRLGRAARLEAERWDWRYQATRYDAMLRSMLDARAPR